MQIILKIIGAILILALTLEFVRMILHVIRLNKNLKDGEDCVPKKGYVETTGYFTGATEFREKGKSMMKTPEFTSMMFYEVKFLVDGEYRRGWYAFYPLPEPEESVEGLRVKVSYQKKKPWNFEITEMFSGEDSLE